MAAVAVQAAEDGGGEFIRTDECWRDDVRRRALARRSHVPVRPLRVRRLAWLVALALHLLLVVSLRVVLQRPLRAPPAADVLRVDLVEPAPAEAPVSPPPPLASVPAPRAPIAQRPQPHAEPEPLSNEPEPRAQPRLFNPDGSVALPSDIDEQLERSRPRPDFIARRIEPSPLLMARRPLKVRPNHFAASWSGTDGQPLSQSIWQPLTFVTEFKAPWGGRYACGWILIFVACGDIPDKPWNPPQGWKPASVLDEQ
jgi:hypothetical protein